MSNSLTQRDAFGGADVRQIGCFIMFVSSLRHISSAATARDGDDQLGRS
jgi:hypothetical protein